MTVSLLVTTKGKLLQQAIRFEFFKPASDADAALGGAICQQKGELVCFQAQGTVHASSMTDSESAQRTGLSRKRFFRSGDDAQDRSRVESNHWSAYCAGIDLYRVIPRPPIKDRSPGHLQVCNIMPAYTVIYYYLLLCSAILTISYSGRLGSTTTTMLYLLAKRQGLNVVLIQLEGCPVLDVRVFLLKAELARGLLTRANVDKRGLTSSLVSLPISSKPETMQHGSQLR